MEKNVDESLFEGAQFGQSDLDDPIKGDKIDDFDLDIWQKRFVQDTKHRSELVVFTKFVVKLWIVSVIIILLLCGCEIINFRLDNSVLCTLLGTTTMNVIGLAYIILKGLFYRDSMKLGKNEQEEN
ncbi:MAG: hypothetical protein MJZ33_05280 [Paludibacteraceae bacterium]|nr:hypothetical protein [Paludibacteraceae bacterium]